VEGETTNVQAQAPQPPHEPVAGRYELIEPAGEGNFSITYQARDLRLGRLVAVKLLRPQYAADAAFVSRFEREAQVAASISHPNVVDVYDFGAYQDTFFIAMQYVPGRTLRQEIDAAGRLDTRAAVRIARQILAGLGAIHAAGIIHRDIKPQNVLLGRDGEARVTDFGIAHGAIGGALTTHGTTVGTASYMAPEQARGGVMSPATDLYAVGVVLFEMLTGRLPFIADNPMAVMLAHLQQPPPQPSLLVPDAGIPAALEAEVMLALAKDPAARPASAHDMTQRLAGVMADREPSTTAVPANRGADTTTQMAVLDEPPVTAVRIASAPGRAIPAPPILPTRRQRRRSPWLAPLAVFATAILILAAIVASRTGLPGGADEQPTSLPVAAMASSATASAPGEPPAAGSQHGQPTPVSISGAILATSTAVSTATSPPDASTSVPQPTETSTAAPTELPAATSEPAPTDTPVPTDTPPPLPTNTPEPEPTATPEPPPTDTPEPTPEPVVRIEPISGSVAVAEETPPGTAPESSLGAGTIASFSATDWQGASSAGESDRFGEASVGVFGTESAYPSATLRFTLSRVPSKGVTFFVSGLDDDDPTTDATMSVAVNGSVGFDDPSPFDDCICAAGDEGAIAPWKEISFALPASVLRAGTNRIAISLTTSGASIDGAPYIRLGDARIERVETP